MEPFTISVPEEVLQDLRYRLEHTRWTPDFNNDNWAYGANSSYLKTLVDYWLNEYDWRKREALMNSFSHFRTSIDGIPIHFIYEKGKGPSPKPLILNHGWPWSFWDYQKIIRPLTDPASYGGDPEDAFDIIVPSLPGYGFSSPLTVPGVNWVKTADLWVKLMEELGYSQFFTQGGDWGAILSAELGHKYADRVKGVHLHLITPLDVFNGGQVPKEDYEPDYGHLFEKNMAFWVSETGYMQIQSTKPQTPAVALNDSPAGLLAWIVEKRRTWSDCKGNVESVFTKDELLDTIMIYWITQTYNTSARYYYEIAHNPWQPSHDRMPVVESPVGVLFFPNEIVQQPRKWAERYYNLKRWTEMEEGGHFAAMEQPEALVGDIRDFFRSLD